MAFQTIFKRYELKYIITKEQKEAILKSANKYMTADKYGKSTIRNVYFDTDSYRLIRQSIEKPVYKEKLRIRCYCKATEETTVFVELKKKYKRVVYKRRLSMTQDEAMRWICDGGRCEKPSQISNEIDYFISYYGKLRPSVFLSYEREAYYANENADLRLTFDENVLCRTEDISLKSEVYGESLLPDGYVLLEIKCSQGLPLWLTQLLSEQQVYKTSFSKYGTAYERMIFPKIKEKVFYDKQYIQRVI